MKAITILTAVVITAGFGLTRISTNGVAGNQDNEVPTVVQEGVMSEKQREHSKLYKDYSMGQRTIAKELESGAPSLRIKIGPPLVFAERNPSSLHNFLQNLTCKADAVVEGRVTDKSSQLTLGEDFLFTDYDFIVEEVFKDNVNHPLVPQDKITITRPGGAIRLNGKTVEAIDTSFQALRVGKRYLLFLNFIPATGAYKAVNSRGSFQLDATKLTKLTSEQIQLDKDITEVGPFLTEVRAATATNCSNR